MMDIKGRIAALFLEKLNLEVPATEIDLLETRIIDSLAFVELLLHVEQEFGFQISIDEFEMDHFRSIAKIAAFISRRCETA
jgi:methoxymalonate biosynthesis acyl carrier protein